MPKIRPAAVAGMFYPEDPQELRNTIYNMLKYVKLDCNIPKAIIVPHAGYIYSGEIAASAYASLTAVADKIKRVILLGPAHRYPLHGIATVSVDYFSTPLGVLKIDHEAINSIRALSFVIASDEAHIYEHCLEVQLPFLQVIFNEVTIVPLLASLISVEQVASILETLWDGPETLIVISTDLSHYHDYATAKKLDGQAAESILTMDSSTLREDQACGNLSIKALLTIAKRKGLQVKMIDMRNSGDTAGSKDQVVGYGAFHFYETQD